MTTTTLKIRRHGNSLGLTLPGPMVEALHLKEGDEVHVSQTQDGIVVRAHDPAFDDLVEAEEWVARRYRNAFKALSNA